MAQLTTAAPQIPDPAEVLELEAWSQVSDSLVREIAVAEDGLSSKQRITQQIIACAAETQQRSVVWCDQSLAFHQLVAKFVDALSMVRQNNEAVEELLAWKDILECHPIPHTETSVSAKEQQLQESVLSPNARQLEVERVRMEEARDDAQRELDSALAGLEAGHREKAALERQLEGLLSDRNSFQENILTLRVEQAEERHRLDAELKQLRDQVHIEQSLLKDLKIATNAAALTPTVSSSPTKLNRDISSPSSAGADTLVSPIAAPRHHMNGGNVGSGIGDSEALDPRQMSPMVGQQSSPTPSQQVHYTSSRSPRGVGNSSESAPSLNSGLRALQNVREQLREIRESHMSPESSEHQQRAYSYTVGSTSSPAAGLATTPGGLQRANTSLGSGYASSGTRGGLGSASLASDDAASPWRQRLSKLQGDLRMLKSELGTSM